MLLMSFRAEELMNNVNDPLTPTSFSSLMFSRFSRGTTYTRSASLLPLSYFSPQHKVSPLFMTSREGQNTHVLL